MPTPDNKKIISLAALSEFKNLLIQDFNGRYVPYFGADASVNLGANDFITESLFEVRSVSNDVINAYTRYRAGSVVVSDASAQNSKIINFPAASYLENSNTFATQEWANSNLVKINDNINIVHTGSTAHGSVTVNSPTGIQSEAYARIRTYAEGQYAYGELIVSGYSGTTRYRRDYIQVGDYKLNFPSLSADKTFATTDQLLQLVSSGGDNGSASTAARSDHTHALATPITYDDNNNEVLGQSGFMNTYEKTWLTAAFENNILAAGTTFYGMGSISYLKLPGPGQGTTPQQRSLSFPNSSGVIATQEWINSQGYTSNQGTVTSVTIGVGAGLAIDDANAITTSGTRTISIASNYKLPTTSEWNAKANSSDLGSAAAKNYTTSVTSGSSDLVTSGAVFTAISNLPTPMQFKGTLGVGGTISVLPDASASNNGYTYKVISDITTLNAKVGDVFVSNGTSWVLIPAGDDVEDTWREIYVDGALFKGSGISSGRVNFVPGQNVTIRVDGNDITISSSYTNSYHTSGSWSGLTYTATANGGAGALVFTIPTGTTASTVALGNHNHDSTYLKLTGGNVTGPIQVTLNSGNHGEFKATRGNYSLWFGIGSGDVNRGIFDDTNHDWMIYRDASTNVYINGAIYENGTALSSKYLALAGGTMTGVLALKGEQYFSSNSVYGMHANNSDIVGVNSIYTMDLADTTAEGIRFYRDSTHWDSFTISGGVMYFMANDSKAGSPLSNAKIVLHSGNIGSYAITSLAGSGSATSAARSDHTHALATAITYDDNNNEVLGQSGFMSTYEKTWLTAALENNVLLAGTTSYGMGSISYLKLPGPGQGTTPQQRSLSFPNSSGTIATQEWVGDQGYTTDSVSGANDGTNWTSITINGVTKNIPSGGGGGGITEISTQYIRIWDLEPGIYLLTYNGTKYIYYSGASGTSTHTVKGGSGKVILTVETYNTTTKFWYYDSINSTLNLTSYTRFYGKTTSSSGTTSSILLVPKTIYKHDVLFTLSGYGSFAFTYYNSSSSAALPVALAEMLKGQVLANLAYTDGSGLCIFGDYTSSRLDVHIYFTLYNNSNGNVVTYTANQLLTIDSDTATAL